MPPTGKKKQKTAEGQSPATGRTYVDATSPFSTGPSFGRGTHWPHHDDSDDSDGFSDHEISVRKGTTRVYRALSDADATPLTDGISAAMPRKKSRTVAQHVQGGGNSPFISLTTNKRKAIKWAKKEGNKNAPRIATIDLPHTTPVVDFSDPSAAQRAQLGSTGANFARSSSELLVKGPISKTNVRRVERIAKVTKTTKASSKELFVVKTRVHTGTQATTKKPQQFALLPEVTASTGKKK